MIKNKIYIVIYILLATACQSPHEEAESHLQKGKNFFDKGEYDKALLELKSSTQDEIHDETYYYLALLDERRNNFKGVRENLLKAVELNPGLSVARVKLAKVHILFGDFDKAAQQAESVLKVNPENLDAQLVLATVYVKENKNVEADRLFADIFKNNPDNVESLSLRASQLYQQQHVEEALSLLEQALGKDSKNMPTRLLRIKINVEQQNSDAVIADYKELIKFFPDVESFKLTLAGIYARSDNLEGAEALLRELVDKTPAIAEPKVLLLEFLNAKAKKERVGSEYEHFLASIKPMPKQWLELSNWMLGNGYMDLAEKGLKQVIAAENDSSELDFKDRALKSLKQLFAAEKHSMISLTAQAMLAEIALNKKQYDEVQAKVNAILQDNPDFIDASLLKARLFLTQNKPDAVIDLLNNVIWTQSNSDAAYELLGEAYTIKKDQKQAETNFKKALEINPANLGAFFPVYRSMLQANQKESALQCLNKALTLRPNQEFLLTEKVQLDIAGKNWVDAQEAVGRLALFAKNKAVPTYLLANIFQDKGQYPQAIKLYEKLLEEYPDDLNSLVNLTRSLEALKSRDKAVAFLQAHHAKYPDNLKVISVLGGLYINNKDYLKAEELYANQIKHMPNSVALYLGLAKIEAIMHKSSDVIKDVYLKGLEANPNDVALSLALADWYELTGDTPNSRKVYEKLLEIQPTNDIATNNLAILLVNSGKTEDAVKGRALSEKLMHSENPSFQDTYAWALVETGHAVEGLKLLESIVLKEPRSPEYRYHLGVAHFKTGNMVTAIVELKKAIALSEAQHHNFFGKNEAIKILQDLEHSEQKG